MTVIGLDLSLTATGLVAVHNEEIIERKIIKSKPNGVHTISELKRLLIIRGEIWEVVERLQPQLVVIEGLAYAVRNTKSLSQLAGINFLTREWLHESEISCLMVAPTLLKKFLCDKGNAPKDIMLLETFKRYGVSFDDNNLCDAYMLCQLGLAILDNPTKPLTKFQIESINKLKLETYG